MKRIGVAALITRRDNELLMGRRAKDPNRGKYVFPGGGVEEGESLEQALVREVKEETGYTVFPNPDRWNKPVHIVELEDRIIIFVEAQVKEYNDPPIAGSDLEDIGWFWQLPEDTSPVVMPIWFAHKHLKEIQYKSSYYNPYDGGPSSW